jgi:hypothetical protein
MLKGLASNRRQPGPGSSSFASYNSSHQNRPSRQKATMTQIGTEAVSFEVSMEKLLVRHDHDYKKTARWWF